MSFEPRVDSDVRPSGQLIREARNPLITPGRGRPGTWTTSRTIDSRRRGYPSIEPGRRVQVGVNGSTSNKVRVARLFVGCCHSNMAREAESNALDVYRNLPAGPGWWRFDFAWRPSELSRVGVQHDAIRWEAGPTPAPRPMAEPSE